MHIRHSPRMIQVSSGGICLMCTHDSMSVELAGLFLPTAVPMLCYLELSVICHYHFYVFLDMMRNEIEVLIFGPPRAVPCHPERPAAGSTTSSLHHDRFVQRLMEQSM